jgi:O-antigen ligase
MKTTLRSLTAGRSPWETGLIAALALALLFSQISVSFVQSFLGIALVAWIVLLVREKRRFAFPAFFWPLLVYSALSLVSSAFSRDPAMSFKDARKLLLYILIPVVFTAFTRREEIELLFAALLGSGFINAIYSIAYEIFKAYPGQRVKGFMGHYMTQAGLLVLFGALAQGFVLFGRGAKRLVWSAGLVLASIALVLTLTRSGWIGLAVALCVALFLWKPKTLLTVPILAALFFFLSPRPVKDRVLSMFTARDSSNQARVEYVRAGIKIVGDYPLFGTGPDTVNIVFQNPKYGLDELARQNVHLHNNILQIAAERGIAALLAWLAFLAAAFVSLARLMKKKDVRLTPLAAGALAALAAFTAAGFFEYNFGDSEVSTLLLFLITLPFALERLEKGARAEN